MKCEHKNVMARAHTERAERLSGTDFTLRVGLQCQDCGIKFRFMAKRGSLQVGMSPDGLVFQIPVEPMKVAILQ